ncbi:MAG: 2-oxoglutarate dehydrogenase complex dihydrolipoyllysine-residue succinyltransferase [Alphaproteobacteria bacterium]|nr:2-oxoglutarate dehydrogenase complex dihydrolipoyllysine-residue succinyltransferase [Alphaproteobacteria bacterium]
MTIEIRVPGLGESVTEATVGKWLKAQGDTVRADEPLVELETDKVTVEVPAPQAGVLSEILVQPGGTIAVGGILGMLGEGSGAAAAPPKPKPLPSAPVAAPAPKPAAAAPTPAPQPPRAAAAAPILSPSARKIAEENNVAPQSISPTGREGRVTKGDVLAAIEARANDPKPVYVPPSGPRHEAAREERVPMSRLRRTIALRLKEAQNTAAMLTTFNEVDMSSIMHLRAAHKDTFEKRYGVRLGFMSFFVKACIIALKEIPSVNGEIEGDEMVYKNYYDIGVAVGTERGLVVPVVRDADRLNFAEIEKKVNDFGLRARDNKLKLEELQGGTFTISNGGVYGSLMSTPILNVPQSGILGMHKIEQRPVAIDGKVEIRPMMYLALSYDHRLVDGKEAVTFLVRVKECLEAPERLVLEL